MDLETKLAEAKKLIEDHNQTLVKLNVPPIDADKVIENIKINGGTSLERLRYFDSEDILDCFSLNDSKQRPTVLAKEIVELFQEGKQRRRVKAELMTARELIEAYDPGDPDSPVGKRLKEISRGEPFLVFEADGRVNPSVSETLLGEVSDGYHGRKAVNLNGRIAPVFSIGERSDNLVDENPLYPGKPLRPDGTCDQTDKSWTGVPLEVRQFVRLALDMGVIKIASLLDAHKCIADAHEANALTSLRDWYRGVAVRFDILAKENKLPSLKMRLGKTSIGKSGDSLWVTGEKVAWL